MIDSTDETADAVGGPAQRTLMLRTLDYVWGQVVGGDESWNPDRSCYDLVEDYRSRSSTTDKCVASLINWQTAKTSGTGFVLGLPGLVFAGITIPADLTMTTYVQLRMVATIALLHRWDVRSDQVRTLAYLSLLGSGAAEALRGAGVQTGTKFTAAVIKKIPGKVLININRMVGFRLLTKAGTTGVINLTKLVPVVGGLVSGGMNGMATRRIGYAAHRILREGPEA